MFSDLEYPFDERTFDFEGKYGKVPCEKIGRPMGH